MFPEIVAHADWSTAPAKRWMAMARLHDGVYRVEGPEGVRNPETLLESCRRAAGGGGALVGFDFPIRLPSAYARRAGIADFRRALPAFGAGPWHQFFEPAARPEEIALERPFYPARPGGTRQVHLVEGLGMASMDDLLRECERDGGNRRGACSLFWTLGGNQVGRAAINPRFDRREFSRTRVQPRSGHP